MKLEKIIENKRVLFITTKNIDYIRNTQEIRIIEKYSRSHKIIFSKSNNYFVRVLAVLLMIKKRIIEENDVIFIIADKDENSGKL